MVHRDNEPRACGIGHLYRLLGGAMRLDPGVVSTDRHNCYIDWPLLPQRREVSCHRGVAGEKYAASGSLQQVPIITAMRIALHARAPMLHRERRNYDFTGSSGKDFLLAPIKFQRVGEPGRSQQVRGRTRGEHGGGLSETP